MSLDELRKQIDELDRAIVRIINQRAEIARQIGELKSDGNKSVYAPAREQAVYDNAISANPGPLDEVAIRSVFREIMSGCIALEKQIKISYLGPPGTFTHWAARSKFGDCVSYGPAASMDEVFEEVERKRADYGVVPVENSTEGGIRETLARFLDSPLKVCAEILAEIHHSLLARGPLEQITKVYSKGTVFGQTRRWLKAHLPEAELTEVSSTSRAAELAAAEDGAAAIGHADLAACHGLKLLFDHIEDLAHNVTRFFVLGRHMSGPTGDDKTAILCSTEDRVGALHDVLAAFKQHHINMTKIESFPSPTMAWQYYFFVDFIGHPDEELTGLALEEMRRHSKSLKILGAFPRCPE